MFKKIISIVPMAAMLTVGATAHASTITVEKGDTLWDLAQANNTSVEAIQTVNDLSTDLIHPGDLLTIAQEKQYTVNLGDTLWDIAIAHKVSVSQIKEWNNLQSDLIHPGLNLLIYSGAKASNTVVNEKPAAAANITGSAKEASEAAAPSTSNEISKNGTPAASAPATSNETAKDNAPAAPAASSEVSTESAQEESAKTSSSTDLKVLTMEATAYTASCEGCSGITSTGINLIENPDAKVISVDPTVIPLGSKVFVEGYGEAIAGDTGSGIKGNKIDVFISSKEEAIKFGVKQLKVTILD
ncbi:LysM peptidoglycan-binding domain-containing protein [Lysinibacillus fusiformis]|nr:LysM peptidoglycan-binding domain-containing protein [Lysinibacillus fusiformis]